MIRSLARNGRGAAPAVMFVKYGLAGGAGAALDMAIFFALVEGVGLHYAAAAVIAFAGATALNYALSVRFVFGGGRFPPHAAMGLVFLASLVGIGINLVMIAGVVEALGGPPMVGKTIGVGVAFFWNFYARRRWIFAA